MGKVEAGHRERMAWASGREKRKIEEVEAEENDKWVQHDGPNSGFVWILP